MKKNTKYLILSIIILNIKLKMTDGLQVAHKHITVPEDPKTILRNTFLNSTPILGSILTTIAALYIKHLHEKLKKRHA